MYLVRFTKYEAIKLAQILLRPNESLTFAESKLLGDVVERLVKVIYGEK